MEKNSLRTILEMMSKIDDTFVLNENIEGDDYEDTDDNETNGKKKKVFDHSVTLCDGKYRIDYNGNNTNVLGKYTYRFNDTESDFVMELFNFKQIGDNNWQCYSNIEGKVIYCKDFEKKNNEHEQEVKCLNELIHTNIQTLNNAVHHINPESRLNFNAKKDDETLQTQRIASKLQQKRAFDPKTGRPAKSLILSHYFNIYKEKHPEAVEYSYSDFLKIPFNGTLDEINDILDMMYGTYLKGDDGQNRVTILTNQADSKNIDKALANFTNADLSKSKTESMGNDLYYRILQTNEDGANNASNEENAKKTINPVNLWEVMSDIMWLKKEYAGNTSVLAHHISTLFGNGNRFDLLKSMLYASLRLSMPLIGNDNSDRRAYSNEARNIILAEIAKQGGKMYKLDCSGNPHIEPASAPTALNEGNKKYTQLTSCYFSPDCDTPDFTSDESEINTAFNIVYNVTGEESSNDSKMNSLITAFMDGSESLSNRMHYNTIQIENGEGVDRFLNSENFKPMRLICSKYDAIENIIISLIASRNITANKTIKNRLTSADVNGAWKKIRQTFFIYEKCKDLPKLYGLNEITLGQLMDDNYTLGDFIRDNFSENSSGNTNSENNLEKDNEEETEKTKIFEVEAILKKLQCWAVSGFNTTVSLNIYHSDETISGNKNNQEGKSQIDEFFNKNGMNVSARDFFCAYFFGLQKVEGNEDTQGKITKTLQKFSDPETSPIPGVISSVYPEVNRIPKDAINNIFEWHDDETNTTKTIFQALGYQSIDIVFIVNIDGANIPILVEYQGIQHYFPRISATLDIISGGRDERRKLASDLALNRNTIRQKIFDFIDNTNCNTWSELKRAFENSSLIPKEEKTGNKAKWGSIDGVYTRMRWLGELALIKQQANDKFKFRIMKNIKVGECEEKPIIWYLCPSSVFTAPVGSEKERRYKQYSPIHEAAHIPFEANYSSNISELKDSKNTTGFRRNNDKDLSDEIEKATKEINIYGEGGIATAIIKNINDLNRD